VVEETRSAREWAEVELNLLAAVRRLSALAGAFDLASLCAAFAEEDPQAVAEAARRGTSSDAQGLDCSSAIQGIAGTHGAGVNLLRALVLQRLGLDSASLPAMDARDAAGVTLGGGSLAAVSDDGISAIRAAADASRAAAQKQQLAASEASVPVGATVATVMELLGSLLQWQVRGLQAGAQVVYAKAGDAADEGARGEGLLEGGGRPGEEAGFAAVSDSAQWGATRTPSIEASSQLELATACARGKDAAGARTHMANALR